MSEIKKRKNCGPVFVSKIKALTTNLYNECVEEARDQIETEFQFSPDGFLKNNEDFMEHIQEIKKKAHEIYQKKILTLSDQELHDILFVHEKGKFMRAPYTIEGIVSELTRRAIFNDRSGDDS